MRESFKSEEYQNQVHGVTHGTGTSLQGLLSASLPSSKSSSGFDSKGESLPNSHTHKRYIYINESQKNLVD